MGAAAAPEGGPHLASTSPAPHARGNLLAPTRARRVLGPHNHDGTIIPEKPNQMWGTDATASFTEEDGQVTVFLAVDHYTAECVGIHAAKPGTHYEALEPLRQGIRSRFGAIGFDVAQGLSVRHDHGSQYTSDAFQDELLLLGIESSPAFVRAPEGNGCAERLIPRCVLEADVTPCPVESGEVPPAPPKMVLFLAFVRA
jgi:transposase InsO family protein